MSEDIDIRIVATETGAARVIRKTAEGLDDLDDSLQAGARRMAVFSEKLQGVGKYATVGAGALGAITGAAMAFANSTADAGNVIDKQAKALGLTAEELQELTFAIGQVSDVTDGQFSAAIRQMTTRLGQAADGSKSMVEAFGAIGISQAEIESGSITTEEAISRMIGALQDAETPQKAAAMAGRLLGEEAARLGPILREAGGDIEGLRARAHELGIVMSNDAVSASASYTDKMDEMQRQMQALRVEIGSALLPVLTGTLLPAIQDKVIPALAGFAEKVGHLIEWFGNLPGPVQEGVGVVAAALGAGGPILLALGTMGKAFAGIIAATGPIGLFVAAAVGAYTAWQLWGDEITAAVQRALDTVQASFEGALTYIGSIPERMAEFGRNIVEGLRLGILEQWEALKETLFELVDFLPNFVKEKLDIRSPSRVFAEIGQQIGAGLAMGIQDSTGMVSSALSILSGNATNEMKNSVNSVLGSLGTLFNESKKFALAQGLVNTALAATEALKIGWPQGIPAYLKTFATGMGAVKAIRGARPGSAGSSGGGGGGSSSSGAQAAPARSRPLAVSLNTVGDGEFLRVSDLGSLLGMLSEEAGDRGIDFTRQLA